MTEAAEPIAPKLAAGGDAKKPVAMQAVVVIHGMGEQRPMDTIKAFVKAVWQDDRSIAREDLPDPTEVWSKPDTRTGSLELRRITTRETIASDAFPGGARTDFFELYWADLTGGSTWEQFTAWVGGLLFRPLSRVPRGVRLAWFLLWLLSLLTVALAVIGLLPASVWQAWPKVAKLQWLFVAAAAAATAEIHKVVAGTFGRVVRYTKATPDNIAARAAVRERGLALLRALHNGTSYGRIIVVSHSLGTMLAHDLLSYFWAERDAARKIGNDAPEFQALCDLESAAKKLAANPDTRPRDPGAKHPAPPSETALKDYFAAQRRLRTALARRPPPDFTDPKQHDPRWLITDFITLGSPLAHAEFLIVASKQDLDERKSAREMPESPPYRELLDPDVLKFALATGALPVEKTDEKNYLISFPVPPAHKIWELHHGAPFAVVRWTNIYDPSMLVLCGDIIGGPLKDVFGPAIVDVNLKTLRGGRQSWCFTHTKYWTVDDEPKHIMALRTALNLLDKEGADPNSA
jgi:hypothetical protein